MWNTFFLVGKTEIGLNHDGYRTCGSKSRYRIHSTLPSSWSKLRFVCLETLGWKTWFQRWRPLGRKIGEIRIDMTFGHYICLGLSALGWNTNRVPRTFGSKSRYRASSIRPHMWEVGHWGAPSSWEVGHNVQPYAQRALITTYLQTLILWCSICWEVGHGDALAFYDCSVSG